MKIQIKFQKILFIVSLIIAALAFVYGLSFCTGAVRYAFEARTGNLGGANRNNPINADELYKFVMGKEYANARWADNGTGFNSLFVILAIVLVVIAALQFLFASNSRRNYYITNYISVGVFAAFILVVAIVGFWGIAHTEALFEEVNLVKWKELYDAKLLQYYDDSHVMFALGYALCAIMIVDAMVLVLNTVWKVLLMKGEKALLSNNNLNTKTIEEVAQ